MFQIEDAHSRSALRSVVPLALIAPLLVGSVIALSSAVESSAREERASGALRSTQIKPVNLADLPASAFGDSD
jgi:hypothetical protein